MAELLRPPTDGRHSEVVVTRDHDEGCIELTVSLPALGAPRVYAYPLTDTLRQFFTELGACPRRPPRSRATPCGSHTNALGQP